MEGFATPDQIIDAVCSAFNAHSEEIGYKAQAKDRALIQAREAGYNPIEG